MFQILAPLNLKDLWYLVQVVAYKRLKTTRKLLNRQAKNWSQSQYERPSFTRGCDHRILTGKIFVFG